MIKVQLLFSLKSGKAEEGGSLEGTITVDVDSIGRFMDKTAALIS